MGVTARRDAPPGPQHPRRRECGRPLATHPRPGAQKPSSAPDSGRAASRPPTYPHKASELLAQPANRPRPAGAQFTVIPGRLVKQSPIPCSRSAGSVGPAHHGADVKEISDSKNVTKLIAVFCDGYISNALGSGTSWFKIKPILNLPPSCLTNTRGLSCFSVPAHPLTPLGWAWQDASH